jgi:hypothetical protein
MVLELKLVRQKELVFSSRMKFTGNEIRRFEAFTRLDLDPEGAFVSKGELCLLNTSGLLFHVFHILPLEL